jgi:hypothetical protein
MFMLSIVLLYHDLLTQSVLLTYILLTVPSISFHLLFNDIEGMIIERYESYCTMPKVIW